MKAKIISATFKKEWSGKYGVVFTHEITYENDKGVKRKAEYNSKSKTQDYFTPGKECEFMEEEYTRNDQVYFKVKPAVQKGKYTDRGKSIRREQARYSAFSMSYAKDLLIAGIIKDSKQMFDTSTAMFNHMVELDKTLLNDNSDV